MRGPPVHQTDQLPLEILCHKQHDTRGVAVVLVDKHTRPPL